MKANSSILELTANTLEHERVGVESDGAECEALSTARAKLEDRFRRAFAQRVRADATQRRDRVA
jgi:hypothetical protein